MATLIKEEHGLIYKEDFQENPGIWSLTPSNVDCIRYEIDGLHILHNKKYVTYTMKEKDEDYCAIIELTHEPLTNDDIGGVIILSNTNDYSECQTYLADVPSTIENNGANINAGYDLDAIYPRYTFSDSNVEDESSDDSSFSEPEGFVDIIYRYIKIIKHNNTGGSRTYQFFASHDGLKWIEVGNSSYYTNNSIGFFLYGTTDENLLQNGEFVINNFTMYSKMYITIKGINLLQDFELLDKYHQTIMRSDTTPGNNMVSNNGNSVFINSTYLPLPLRDAIIRIYPKGEFDHTIAQYTLENLTYGGDVFSINYDIKLFIDNEEIESGKDYDLGYLFTDTFKRNIVVYNNEDFDLLGIKVSIVAYSEYFYGEDVVKIALWNTSEENDEELSPEYSDEVIINKLNAHNGAELIMKLSDIPKRDFYSVTSKYKFKLLIDN